MPTTAGSTARGFPYPGDTTTPADGPAAFKALADAVEAEFDEALALGSTLTVQNDVTVQGTEPHVNLKDTDASANLKYSRIRNATGHTYLMSMTDDGSSTRHVAIDHDHNTGIVNFPTGVTVAGVPVVASSRGKSIIATTESRTNTAYGTLTTPDQVSVTLPTDGLIKVLYQATWQESVAGAARAAIFIGSNQLVRPIPGGAPTAQDAQIGGTPALYTPLSSFGAGLSSGSALTADSTEVTTGQLIASSTQGGALYIDKLPAGTYTISVQFKASSGTVTVKDRRLRVAVETF